MMNILIADDHKMFVEGVQSILAQEKDLEVVECVYDGASVFQVLHQHQIDLILLDVNLPELNGLEVCQRIQREGIEVKILILSMLNEEGFIKDLLANGANGYVLKSAGKDELLRAIRAVQSGETYYSPEVMKTMMHALSNKKKADKNRAKFPKLSRREKQVLQLIINERTTQEIADELFISLNTVESHRSNILRKLNARNTAGLVRIAIENKLLD